MLQKCFSPRMACNILKPSIITKLKLYLHTFDKAGPRQCIMCKRHVFSSFRSYQKSDEALTRKNVSDKIVFNSKLSLKLPKKVNTVSQHSSLKEDKIDRPPVLALKYFEEHSNEPSNNNNTSSNDLLTSPINLPYKQYDNVDIQEKIINLHEEETEVNESYQFRSDSPDLDYESLAFSNIKDKNCK